MANPKNNTDALGRFLPQGSATHCKLGHKRTPENTYECNGACRECAILRSRQRYRHNSEAINAARRKGPRAAVPKDVIRANEKARSKRFNLKHRERLVARARKTRFGITPEQYDAMLAYQGGVCAICGNPETAIQRGRVRGLSVDHNHATGKVRGLLCHRCNVAIGLLGDDGDRVSVAAAYLFRWERREQAA